MSKNKVYAIYSDGNYFPRAKKSGFGGYVESPDGQVLVEYTEQIKQPQYVYNFELLGIIRGLQLAQLMGAKHIVSYCDDKTTMLRLEEIVANGGTVDHLPPNAKPELFSEIINLTKNFTSSRFQYIPRSQNKHSDSLSRRYAALMEQNYIRQYGEDLDFSEKALQVDQKPNKRIFFSHPSFVKIKEKNNPFLVAPTRNRKARKASKLEQQQVYQYLFIETLTNEEGIDCLKAFHYKDKDNRTLLATKEFIEGSVTVSEFCHFLSSSIKKVIDLDQEVENTSTALPLWIYSNSISMNKIFEQKDKMPKNDFLAFKDIYNLFDNFPRIMYHLLPFAHQYSIEIAAKEEKKKNLNEDIESLDSLMEKIQNGALGKEKNKCVGKIIRHELRKYRTLLARDLNEVEKQDIIAQTTAELHGKTMKSRM